MNKDFENQRIELGRIARDSVSGFEGRVVGVSRYITGCDQYLLTPRSENPREKKDSHWIDDHRLEVLANDPMELPVKSTPEKPVKPGADVEAPKK